jgi:hypothetical protein
MTSDCKELSLHQRKVKMIRTVIALTCCLFIVPVFSNTHAEEAKEEFFPSTPEQVATLSSERSYLIGGRQVMNIISTTIKTKSGPSLRLISQRI